MVNGIRFFAEECSVLLLPKDTSHKYRGSPDGEWEFYWIHYCGSCSQTVTEDIIKRSIYCFPFPVWEMDSYFSRLRKNVQNGYESEFNVSKILDNILSDILYGSIALEKDTKAVNFVECLISDIENSSKLYFNLSEIASKYHYSKEHIIRKFYNYTGNTPYHYWKFLKFRWASMQLLCSNEPIGEIAKKVGYNKAASFTNEFKKIFNMSPTEYRKTLNTGPYKVNNN